jgi:hypothetical protein
VTDSPEPAWRDPLLLPPPPPSGTGTGAYVEQPEPRPNPMTIEGEIAAFGAMAQGAAKKGGRSGMVARAVIILALVVFFVSAIYSGLRAFR